MDITSSSGIASDPLHVRISPIYRSTPDYSTPGLVEHGFGSLSKGLRFGGSGNRLEVEVELYIGRGVGNVDP